MCSDNTGINLAVHTRLGEGNYPEGIHGLSLTVILIVIAKHHREGSSSVLYGVARGSELVCLIFTSTVVLYLPKLSVPRQCTKFSKSHSPIEVHRWENAEPGLVSKDGLKGDRSARPERDCVPRLRFVVISHSDDAYRAGVGQDSKARVKQRYLPRYLKGVRSVWTQE